MAFFLAPDEIKELTGVRTGKRGKTREQLQAEALRKMRIPFHVNAVGRPIVIRAALTGLGHTTPAPTPSWEPAFAAGHG